MAAVAVAVAVRPSPEAAASGLHRERLLRNRRSSPLQQSRHQRSPNGKQRLPDNGNADAAVLGGASKRRLHHRPQPHHEHPGKSRNGMGGAMM